MIHKRYATEDREEGDLGRTHCDHDHCSSATNTKVAALRNYTVSLGSCACTQAGFVTGLHPFDEGHSKEFVMLHKANCPSSQGM